METGRWLNGEQVGETEESKGKTGATLTSRESDGENGWGSQEPKTVASCSRVSLLSFYTYTISKPNKITYQTRAWVLGG